MARRARFFATTLSLEVFFVSLARGLQQGEVLSIVVSYLAGSVSGVLYHYLKVLPSQWWAGLLSYIVIPVAIVSLTEDNDANKTPTMLSIIVTAMLQTAIFMSLKRAQRGIEEGDVQETTRVALLNLEKVENPDDVCPICLEEIEVGVKVGCCGKAFHGKCITTHVESTSTVPATCPCCRAVIVEP